MKIKPLNEIEEKRANFILNNFLPIPENAVTLLSASGGLGKTRLSLLMADRFVRESNKRATLWLTEDYPGQVKGIFNDMVSGGLAHTDSVNKIDLVLDDPPQLALRENGLFKANYEEIRAIGEYLIKNNTGLAVFDPLLAFYGGNENDNSEARVFIQTFATWAREAQISTLIIHHAGKNGSSRGATAFHDGVRARYEITPPMKEDGEEVDTDLYNKGFRTLTIKKDNWGIRLPFHDLSNGEDSINIKIIPTIKRVEEPIETVFKSDSDSSEAFDLPDLGL